jgi:hypothetical protein
MKIINTRTPFFITVDEINQVGSKIELFIWNDPATEPATATYSLSKKIASFTQTANTYNISSFIQEYVYNVVSTATVVYANVKVKVYKETSAGVYALARTENYIGLNGYNEYFDGANKINENEIITLLANNLKTHYYYRTSPIPYVNVFVDSTVGDTLELNYRDARGRNLVTTVLIAAGDAAQQQLLKVPLTTSSIKYDEQNTLEIKYNNPTSGDYIFNYKVVALCEIKYTPVVCSFINKKGGWEFLTFFKATTQSVTMENTSFKLNAAAIAYDPFKGQVKNFNTNGNESIKLNTGWIEEIQNETIRELMLSETILLDNKPVSLMTKQTILKTDINDKNINYTIDFNYNFELINNVV